MNTVSNRPLPPAVWAIMLCLLGCLMGARAADKTVPAINELKAQAEQQERHGQKREAAQTYEHIIALDPTTRSVLAPRLVQLYLEARQAQPAMVWARQVMTNTPSPNAYLAGIYGRLNMATEARGLLELEIKNAPTPERAWLLRLQLADMLAKSGDTNTASKVLREGAAALPDGPLKQSALDHSRSVAPIRGTNPPVTIDQQAAPNPSSPLPIPH